MDGITALENIMVLAATNRPDMLDPAVLRPGRFDRFIYVPTPDEKARHKIFKIYTKEMPLAKDIDTAELTISTKGYSGADIQSICHEAGMIALRRSMTAKEIKKGDFKEALANTASSLTPEMEKFYANFAQNFKKVERSLALSSIA